MSTVPDFINLVTQHGSGVLFHRDDSLVPCPCRTPEGFRDPAFHIAHPPDQFPSFYWPAGVTFAYDGDTHLVAVYRGLVAGEKTLSWIDQSKDDHTLKADGLIWLEVLPAPGNYIATLVSWAINHASFVSYNSEPITATYGTPYGPQDLFTTDPPYFINPPICNENAMIPAPLEISVKAFVQPAQSTRATRLSAEFIQQMFGAVEADDHVGIFPASWGATLLNFWDWSQDGSDYIIYNDRKFLVVNANLIPDPSDGNPRHHWECGLRVIS
jgi:hypothetical protein